MDPSSPSSLSDLWPLFRIRVRTPILELRHPDEGDLVQLAAAASEGVYDPHDDKVVRTPVAGWTSRESPDRERELARYVWRSRAEWEPDRWNLVLVAIDTAGVVIGTQDIGAQAFRVSKAFSTGSWLARSHQRQGLGKEMRRAVLHLGFSGLGAETGYSAAWDSNAASLGVSQALGYQENGTTVRAFEDQRLTQVNLRIDRQAWQAMVPSDIQLTGLDPDVLAMFGADG